MNRTELIQYIQENITDNDNGLITAQVMRDVLGNIVNESYNQGYTYIGIATPSTTPMEITAEDKVFYIATKEGDYTNFGQLGITKLSILKSDNGRWRKEELIAFDKVRVSPSVNQDAELAISDDSGNVIAQLKGGHIKTKNFDSSVDATPENRGLMSSSDKAKLDSLSQSVEVGEGTAAFGISDENGYIIAKFEDGDIKTKNFNSADVNSLKCADSYIGTDLNVSDETGNVLVKFTDGHIKTKNFDSANIRTDIEDKEYPIFIGKTIGSDTASIEASNDRLVSVLVRAVKGDVVHIYDTTKIDSIRVYEYRYDGPSSALVVSDFTTEDYTVQNSSTSFIRIVGIPSSSDPLFIDGVIYGNAAFVNNVCVIHNTPREHKDNKTYFASTMPSGWYVAKSSEFSTTPESEDPYENTAEKLTLKQIYDILNDLATDYPDYFHLSTIGYDSSEGKSPHAGYPAFSDWTDGNGNLHMPVYKFELVPEPLSVAKNVYRGYNNSTIPTIYVQCGIHPGEAPCIRAMLNFFVHLCRDWEKDEFLSYLRWNCRIVGIPVLVPYSYIDLNTTPTCNGRCNYNGVNINRNFYDGGIWYSENNGSPDLGNSSYKGTTYLSEIETRYSCRAVLENADALFAYDWHTHGVFTSWENITTIALSYSLNDMLAATSIEVTKALTVSGWKNHKLPSDSGWIGHVQNSIGGFGTSHKDNILPTCSPEAMYGYYREGSSGSVYNTYIDTMNEEFFVNMILSALRQNIISNY